MSDDNPTGPQRVTFSLPAEAIDFLKSEAQRTGGSMADVLRRSISTERFLKEASAKGSKILLEDGGRMTQLVFRE